jgi:hypothetical protein
MQTYIDISKLRRDGGTQPREGLNEEHLQDLLTSIQSGADIDAVLAFYDGTNHWLVDGFHRTESHVGAGKLKIKAEIRQGSLQDAQWHSFSVNQHLALKRTNSDKQRAVIGALKHEYGSKKSNIEIAQHCGVSPNMVGDWRESLEKTGELQKSQHREVARNGTTYRQVVKSKTLTEDATPNIQKFKVISTDIPDYFGQIVELDKIKSGDCYQCKTADGKIYPFMKSELGDISFDTNTLTIMSSNQISQAPNELITETLRQKIISIILRLPNEVLGEAEGILLEKYGGILSDEPIGI